MGGRRRRYFFQRQDGAVAIYYLLIIIPILLVFGLLVDALRWKTAHKEAEHAVKAGVRSAMSAYSPKLQTYGLYGLETGEKLPKGYGVLKETVSGNLSGMLEGGSFRFLDHRLETSLLKWTPMYPLASHEVLKQQIMEEMKYRAPLIYALELTDKFKKTKLTAGLGQGSRFGENASRIERLIEQRDRQMDAAWTSFSRLTQKERDMLPFYQTNLRDLNELSARIGIHTVEEVRATLQQSKQQLDALKQQMAGIDGSIQSLATAGAAAAQSISQLIQAKSQLQAQAEEINKKITDYEQLLKDLLHYAELFGMLKLKTASDAKHLSELLDAFQQDLRVVKATNDELNTQLGTLRASGGTEGGLPAEQVFANIAIVDRQELDQWEAETGGAVALFAGVQKQLQDGVLFTKERYELTNGALSAFKRGMEGVYTRMSPIVERLQSRSSSAAAAKREQRNKTQAVLDQVKRSIGVCSLVESVDPFADQYVKLEGKQGDVGAPGYYRGYLGLNQATEQAAPVPDTELNNPDQAGLQALKTASLLDDLLTDIRGEFYVDEFAVSKFSYRTLGLEKDSFGQVKTSKELSRPEQHPLANQEVEYLLYGQRSCAGNYGMAYAELFAFRMAVHTLEALTEPRNEALGAIGSPLLVLLAAIAEGAVRAQLDLAELVHGKEVALSGKFAPAIQLGYKDYLRVFLLLHSRDETLLSRIQALLNLNTGTDLKQTATYVSASAETSFKLWFLPGVMQALQRAGFEGCEISAGRCGLRVSADYTY